MMITKDIILATSIVILLFTSTSSGNVNYDTLQIYDSANNENMDLSSIENGVTDSTIFLQNLPISNYLFMNKSYPQKLNHTMSASLSPLHLILQKTPSKVQRSKLKSETSINKQYSTLTYLNSTPLTLGIPLDNYQTTKSTADKSNIFHDPVNNSSYQADFGGESNSISAEIGNQLDLKTAPIVDIETSVVAKGRQLNWDETRNKSPLNHVPESTQKQSEVQIELKIHLLEEKLKSEGEVENSSLLLAISLLHHHINSTSVTKQEYFHSATSNPIFTTDVPKKKEKHNHNINSNNLLHINRTISPKHFLPLPQYTTTNSPNNPTIETSTYMQKTNHLPFFRSYILVLNGNCMKIRMRLITFVKYLKGTLAAKLSVDYFDIRVPSVTCEPLFTVNVSLNEHKYPNVYSHLKKLAESNITLLEISGQIIYLEQVLTSLPKRQFRLKDYFGGEYELQVIAFVSAICMCVFVTIAVATFYLLKCYYCRLPPEVAQKEDFFEEKSPNIIYSVNFATMLNFGSSSNTQKRTSEPLQINSDGNSHLSREVDVFKSVNGKIQTFSKSSSQLKLMEEIQEDEECVFEDLLAKEISEC